MIVESPNKIEKLSEILGQGWKIAASCGHVRDLPEKDMGVDAPEFRPRYEVTEQGERAVGKLRNLVREADEVYLATDPDREGESISWHLQQCLQLKNPVRVTFNAVSRAAVEDALARPRRIDLMRVAAQEARRVLDRLVGYMVSPKLRQQTGQPLSAGRVQSPAVRLVVERERQIRNFQKTTHFGAELFFAHEKLEWVAAWLTQPNFVSEENPYFLDRAFAEDVADLRYVTVASFDESEARRSPPAPFTTSTMQQAGSVALGLNPKATMDAAQELFAQGHITYHRTDNPNVDAESLPDIRAVAESLGLEMAAKHRRFKVPEGAQEGHPAITPTHWEIEEAGETPVQRQLYKMIRLRAIASQLADAIYAVRTVELVAQDQVRGRDISFGATGRTVVFSGWLKLLDGDQTEEHEEREDEGTNPIPVLEPGMVLTAERGELREKVTKAPPRYTEASLVAKLESEGIGRPATYATIMDNITSRDYVRVTKRLLSATPTGELIYSALVNQFGFVDLGFTREIERELDRIARGEAEYAIVVGRVYEQLRGELSTLVVDATPAHPCAECGKAMRRVKGGSGFFWGCVGFPECKATAPDNKGVPGTRPALSDFACAKCGKALVHRSKAGKKGYDFWGCSGYPACDATYTNAKGKPDIEAKR